MELMKAVDDFIPQPDRPKDKTFLNASRRCFLNFKEEELLLLEE